MRQLLYSTASHYNEGRALANQGDVHGAITAFSAALRDLHAVKPHRKRNILLAQVYISRYQVAYKYGFKQADSDLRMGYSYAKTTKEPAVRELAEKLWQDYRKQK